MKYFNKIILMIQIFFLRKKWENFKKINDKYNKIVKKKRKFLAFIGEAEEDLVLNEDVILNFDKKIKYYQIKKSKLKIKLKQELFDFGLFEEGSNSELFLKFQKYNIKPEKVEFLKLILKEYIKSKSQYI